MVQPDDRLKRAFGRYGREVSFAGHPEKWFAVIEPLRYKNKMYLRPVPTEIGFSEDGYYVYIGPPEKDISDEFTVRLVSGGMTFCIDKAESVYFKQKPLYIRAILREVRT